MAPEPPQAEPPVASSRAEFTGVVMRGSQLEFASHVRVLNYTQVQVADVELADANVAGSHGMGLHAELAGTAPAQLPRGNLASYSAWMRPYGEPQTSLLQNATFAQTGSYLLLTNATFSKLVDPRASGTHVRGGGVLVRGFEYTELDRVHVAGTEVHGKAAGVSLTASYIWVRRSQFVKTKFTEETGGIQLGGAWHETIVSECDFDGNQSPEDGWHPGAVINTRDDY